MTSSGVRAKAAIFGQLTGVSGGGGGSAGRGANDLPASSSSRLRLPPTSSAPDTSISHPISATAAATLQARTIRRQPSAVDASSGGRDADQSIPTAQRAPLPPVKPYAPKLSAAAPQTPFQVSFPAVDHAEASRGAYEGAHVAASHRRIPQSRIPRYAGQAGITASGSSRSELAASTDAALENLAAAADELSRESLYSVASSLGAVVTTANAVSIQRTANPPRTMRNGQTSASSIASTTNDSATRAASQDKGIGVKVRRKSRESSTSERRRPKSGRSSTTPAIAIASDGPSIRIIEPTSVKHRPESGAAGQYSGNSGMAEYQSIAAVSRPFDRPATDTADLLNPMDAARTERTTAADESHDMVRSTSLASTSYEVRNLSSMYSFDPLSDAWGQNSSVASASVDDDLSAMGALSFSSSNSPVGQRARGNKPRLPVDAFAQDTGGWTTPSSTSAEGVALRAPPFTSRSAASSGKIDGGGSYTDPSGRRLVTDPTTTTNNTSSLSDHHSTANAMPNDSGYGAAPSTRKDVLLTQLLASMSLVETQSFETLVSLEQVDALKRELTRVETRIVDVQHKLKVQMRVRDAADKLRRSGGRKRSTDMHASDANSALSSSKAHQRRLSSTSSVAGTGVVDVQQAEADLAAATKRCDQVSRDLMELLGVASTMRRRLLEHHARVLGIRVVELEDEVEQQRINGRAEAESIVDVQAMEASNEKAERAEQELERVRGKVAQVEQVLNRERERHDGEKRQLRQTHEQQTKELVRKHQAALTEHQSALGEASEKMRTLSEQHAEAIDAVNTRATELERRKGTHTEELSARENAYRELQAQMAQLEFETTAERNIMLDRQKLFSAFEHRLERAEKRLREQDDRCARMLGKAEGREEMDDLLNQIKYGSNSADAKKDKTAGQDIDGLIDSLTTHIDDVEDELQRVAGLRGVDGASDYGVGPISVQDAGAVRELAVELQASQRETEEWRTQAENVRRQLAAIQRQSALSITSTNAGVGVGRLSTAGWGTQSNAGGAGLRTRMNSVRSAAELEARVSLLEKRNAALEAELLHVREEQAMQAGVSSSSESGMASGGRGDASFTSTHRKVAGDIGEEGVYAHTVTALLDVLPSLDHEHTADLHELQEELEAAPNNGEVRDLDRADVCRAVQERARKMMFVSRNLVGRALTMEMEKRDLDEEYASAAEEREELKAAMEDLRSGHASQMQVIEAGKTREQQLNVKVHELEQRLTEMRHTVESNMLTASAAAASKGKQHAGHSRAPSLTSTDMRTSRSLGSLGGAATLRRNFMPVASRSARPSASSTATSAVPSANPAPLISPSSSKLSFASNGPSSASTPTSSFPAWSPATAARADISITTTAGEIDAMPFSSRSPSSRLLNVEAPTGKSALHAGDTDDIRSVLSFSSSGGGGKGGRDERAASAAAAAAVPAASTNSATPRMMMLGMGTPQMMQRIRELEADLVHAKLHSQRAKTDEEQRLRVEQQLDECRAELADNRREIDDIRNVESRQRIELLEELTSLTSELSEARSQLRQEQRRKQHTPLQQKALNV